MTTHPTRRRTRPTFKAAATAYSAYSIRTAWTSLEPKDRVIVQEAGKAPFEALVDVLTYDHQTVVWVLPVKVGSRRAFHCNDEVQIAVLISQQPKGHAVRYSQALRRRGAR